MNTNYKNNLSIFKRYKKDYPFSSKLNQFLELWEVESINNGLFSRIDTTDSDQYDTLESITDYYNKTGNLIVWSGASFETIFGNERSNILFRAWHDYYHIVNQFSFDLEGESMTAYRQIADLPSDWLFEKQLVLCEVIGQGLYNIKFGEFPKNQRDFTISYLTHGLLDRQQ